MEKFSHSDTKFRWQWYACDFLMLRLLVVCYTFNAFAIVGKELSLVDLLYTPFLERMSASLPYFKGLRVRGNPRWPHLDRCVSFVVVHCYGLIGSFGARLQMVDCIGCVALQGAALGISMPEVDEGRSGVWC